MGLQKIVCGRAHGFREYLNIKLSDIIWDDTVQVRLHGKGDKVRYIPVCKYKFAISSTGCYKISTEPCNAIDSFGREKLMYCEMSRKLGSGKGNERIVSEL